MMSDTSITLDPLRELAARIDHALLAPNLARRELEAGCKLARKWGVASVCGHPCDARRIAELLEGGRTAAGTVVGFPHGGTTRGIKVAEARAAIEDLDSTASSGQKPPPEIDLVVNISRVVSGKWGAVRDEIEAVYDAVHGRGALLKVIFETGYLTEKQVIRLCGICGEVGVDFVKTSTGFGPRGASIEDVRLMREHSPEAVRIKAAGGIQSRDEAEAMIQAGADRIGTSHTEAILETS